MAIWTKIEGKKPVLSGDSLCVFILRGQLSISKRTIRIRIYIYLYFLCTYTCTFADIVLDPVSNLLSLGNRLI